MPSAGPGASAPGMSAMPTPVEASPGGLPGLPQASLPPMEFEKEVKYCTKCKKEVPFWTKIGHRCPHCGVKFVAEETADGRTVDALGTEVSVGRNRVGGAVGLAAIVAAAIAVFARLFGGRD